MRLLCKKNNDGLTVLRVFGTDANAIIPCTLNGIPITEIGPYCFSDSEKGIDSEAQMLETEEDVEFNECLRPICGANVEYAELPAHIRVINNAAFYNCRMLRKISIGCEMSSIGSDVFVNCTSLTNIEMRCSAGSITGLKNLLSRLSTEIEVEFVNSKYTEARLLYPEYYESYDEIAPAHIFGRNIEGEGFRARQYINDGIVDYQKYDTIFEKACAEENVETLIKMSLDRVLYPYNLSDERKKRYTEYLSETSDSVMKLLVNHKDMKSVELLDSMGVLNHSFIQAGIKYSSDSEWSEGAAYFLDLESRFFSKVKESRYLF